MDATTHATLIAGVHRTEAVTPERAEVLWAQPRKLLFKPATGYGSKAACRDDKLTHKAWEAILAAA